LDGSLGYGAWQWLFIIEGVITVGVALAAIPILPNFPHTTKWLTEEEKALAIWRLEEDIGEEDSAVGEAEQSLWYGAKLAFGDVKTYVLVRSFQNTTLLISGRVLIRIRLIVGFTPGYRVVWWCDQLLASSGQDTRV
jgi:MFS family permease